MKSRNEVSGGLAFGQQKKQLKVARLYVATCGRIASLSMAPLLVALKYATLGAISVGGARGVRGATAGAKRGRVGPLPGRCAAGRGGSY